MDKKKDEIIKLLPLDIRKLFKFCDIEFSKLQEIRLRVNMPIMILYDSMEYFISCRGEMTKERKNGYRVSCAQIKEAMVYISNYSRYAFEEEIRQGFITVEGGHRVGVAGKIIWDSRKDKKYKLYFFYKYKSVP